jgi:hypothetical protein
MRIARRDILPTMTQVAFPATKAAHAVTGLRGRSLSSLAR